MNIYWNDGTSLYHYGIKGQRWGERRFQNEDGSLTEEGRRRYGVVGEARSKAEEFKNMSVKDRSRYQNLKTNRNINDQDKDRWIKVTKKQEKYYDGLIKKFSETDVSKIDKSLIKDAKAFLKNASYVEADYSDVALGGDKYTNYQLDHIHGSDYNRKRR